VFAVRSASVSGTIEKGVMWDRLGPQCRTALYVVSSKNALYKTATWHNTNVTGETEAQLIMFACRKPPTGNES